MDHQPHNPNPPPRPGNSYGQLAAVIAAAAAGLALALIVYVATRPKPPVAPIVIEQSSSPPAPSTAPPTAAPAPTPEKVPPPPPDPMKELLAAPDLAAALQRLSFADVQDEWDAGAVRLAAWADKHMTWPLVSGKDETSFAKVHKDADSERGKRVCVSGSIIEIHVQKVGDLKLALGEIVVGSGNFASFIAVHDTGDLVGRSAARFCGVVTGVRSYANSGGGTTHTVTVVGMFDLPENRAAGPTK